MLFTRHQHAHPDDYTWDKETTGLLDETAIDYTASPYRLKPSFATHCVVFQNHFTGEYIAFHDGPKYVFDGQTHEEEIDGEKYVLANYEALEYTHKPLSELKAFISNTKFRRVIAHNMISFDLLSAKLCFGVEYTLGNEWREGGLTTWSSDTWAGNKIGGFWDTLPLSKCLNPDRYGGHSLEKLASGGTTEKIQFRKHMHPDVRFKHFAADMLYYCIFDVGSNTEVYFGLMDGTKNKEGPNKPGPNLFEREELMKWMSAIRLEHNIADIITRQEHRGFDFNSGKAHIALDELDQLMEDRRVKVEPVLPERPATQAFMKGFTPPVKQIKQNLELTSYMEKFLEKHGGAFDSETREATIFGKKHKLPMPLEPLVTSMKATIDDTTHIKNWLVGLGWNPSEYKEKDITVDTKKNKLTQEKLEIAIDRYLDQTYDMAFKGDRLEHLCESLSDKWGKYSERVIITPDTPRHVIRDRMSEKKTLKVLTNPSFTKGQDKDMCPDLDRISEQFPFAKQVVEYLTYKHRRNSILGGGVDWDDPDEEPEKGYIASVREDGRIATPADTCGAATSRFKHRKVANIPRVTSLYGYQLRDLFGVGTGYYQIGYDFDSLEARIESAYCWQYDEVDHGYCVSLMMDKPNDVHTKMAQAISEIIGRAFGRSSAKNVKYGCTYGAQAAKVAKTIGDTLAVGQQVFDAFWLAAFPLDSLKKALTAQWEANGKKYIIGIDGRRVPTRSAHAILNSLFQSGGVICAKRAMVIHDVKLKQAGLSVDFFKDDWKSKEFCQQMIAYHDEAQLEASAKSFKFKSFTYASIGFDPVGADELALKAHDGVLKERAQKFKNEQLESVGEVWSDISHNDKGFYVAYCMAGQLAVQSVTEAGLFYRANDADTSPVAAHALDLTAGYIVNRSWAGCH